MRTAFRSGINGVEVAKIGDKYYCYVMTNYAYDALYCFDVTNPSKPVLNTDFGTNGYINFSDDQCPSGRLIPCWTTVTTWRWIRTALSG